MEHAHNTNLKNNEVAEIFVCKNWTEIHDRIQLLIQEHGLS